MPIDYRQARRRMVETQMRGRRISTERVLGAFLDMPRHEFVDAALAPQAYSDRALPIGHGQTISQPYMVGIMTALLDPEPHHRILEIGTGSGYQAAILSTLVRSVFTIERIAPLANRAKEIFQRLGLTNIIQQVGDGSLGWKIYAPYDRIIVTAAAPDVPDALRQQLADGGRLIVPTGSRGRQILTMIDRQGEHFRTSTDVPCVFVPLVGKEGWGDAP